MEDAGVMGLEAVGNVDLEHTLEGGCDWVSLFLDDTVLALEVEQNGSYTLSPADGRLVSSGGSADLQASSSLGYPTVPFENQVSPLESFEFRNSAVVIDNDSAECQELGFTVRGDHSASACSFEAGGSAVGVHIDQVAWTSDAVVHGSTSSLINPVGHSSVASGSSGSTFSGSRANHVPANLSGQVNGLGGSQFICQDETAWRSSSLHNGAPPHAVVKAISGQMQLSDGARLVEGGGETESVLLDVASRELPCSSSHMLDWDKDRKDQKRSEMDVLEGDRMEAKRRTENGAAVVQTEDAHSDHSDGGGGSCEDAVEVEKRKARLMRNRESAQLSRQRKKVYVDELEERMRAMNSTIAHLQATIAHLTQENVAFRRQLGYFSCMQPGGGGHVRAGGVVPGVAGHAVPPLVSPYGPPMRPVYPLVNLMPGAVAPPVPIPRLKTSASAASSKTKTKAAAPPPAAVDATAKPRLAKRARTATAVAGRTGVAVLALFCLAMFVGGPLSISRPSLGPYVQHHSTSSSSFNTQGRALGSQALAGGRVLMSIDSHRQRWVAERRLQVNGGGNRSRIMGPLPLHAAQAHRGLPLRNVSGLGSARREDREKMGSAPPGWVKVGRARGKARGSSSVRAMAASVMVTRNNETVKIDGDLIIRAVMAGDEAASAFLDQAKKDGEGGTSAFSRAKDQSAEEEVRMLRKQMALVRSQVGVMLGGEVKALPGGGPSHTSRYDDEEGSRRSTRRGQYEEPVLLDGGGSFGSSFLGTGVCTEVFQFDTSAYVAHGGQGEHIGGGGLDKVQHEMVTEANSMAPVAVSGRVANADDKVKGGEGTDSGELVPATSGRKARAFAVPLPPVNNGKPTNGLERDKNASVAKDVNGGDVGAQEPKRRMLGEKELEEEACGRAGAKPSSMVVSVLANPEGVEYMGEDGAEGGAALKQIFVVVLVGGKKYVTYSCMLPSLGATKSRVTPR